MNHVVLVWLICSIASLCAGKKTCSNEGEIKYDHCNKRCICENGKLKKCCRVRQEFTAMSIPERERYVQAVLTMSRDGKFKKRYQDIVTLHNDLFDAGVHELRQFLPWHRWYMLQYENLLREVDCRVTQPYWDWASVAGHPFRNWYYDVWNDGNHGFGGDGDPFQGGCVTTGPFSKNKWVVTPTGGSGCLIREFQKNLYFPNNQDIGKLFDYNPKQFAAFEEGLRKDIHNPPHRQIGGQMNFAEAPNDPIFWLHHTFIDKIWNDWQDRGPQYKFLEFYTKNKTNNAKMMKSPNRPTELLDIHKQPGGISICYQ